MRVKRDCGSRASTVFMIDRIGVMPLPPTMPTCWRFACGSIGTKKRPCGAITLMVSPGCSFSLIQFEKVPPLTLRTPTRSSPSSTPAQIEYERRRSWPSMSLRKVRYWPWVKPKASRRSMGTSKETMTASSVSGSTARTRSGWKMTLMEGPSDRFEMFEGFAAAHAAVHRLAGGGAEGRQPLGVAAAAARAGHRIDPAAEEADRHRAVGRGRAGRRDAVLGQLAAAVGADPVSGPGRCALQGDIGRAEAGLVDRRQHVVLDHLGRGAAGVGR